MAAFFVTSTGKALVPANKAAAMELEKLRRGVRLKVEPKQPRNGKFHRLAFAFATYVADAINSGPVEGAWDAERVMTHFKLALGHVETVKLRPADAKRLGCTHAVLPRSISFSSMDEAAFGAFMDGAMRHVRDTLAPWIEGSEHWAEIAEILAASGLASSQQVAA